MDGLGAPGWADVHLVHRSLPELALAEIDLSTQVAGLKLPRPILINAMTGGAQAVVPINRDLGRLAAEFDLAIAVGSQTAGIREPEVRDSYRVVRQEHPRGVIIANVSAGVSADDACRAVEMLEADGLQLHLNAPQELMMPEGDRDFRGLLANIAQIAGKVGVPVIVKECGFGVSRETARQLYDIGIRAIDVSGRGGTNFAWIEGQRDGGDLDPGLVGWGIPTAAAVAEVAALELPGLDLIASGGVTYGSEAAKALALGAAAVGVAGSLLRIHQTDGLAAARAYLERLLSDLTRALLLCGAAAPAAMRRRPVVVTGATGDWCRLRGVDLGRLANR
ncbi:MAG TPA: type 2 isopentenyl-diphosphate Delta-isomerase [Symbiobacteriaceae bacterium]|nr:type 2 isopentenyl-diphosphate Delta-isomerase [Symbiobacteriaceae bacterium]